MKLDSIDGASRMARLLFGPTAFIQVGNGRRTVGLGGEFTTVKESGATWWQAIEKMRRRLKTT